MSFNFNPILFCPQSLRLSETLRSFPFFASGTFGMLNTTMKNFPEYEMQRTLLLIELAVVLHETLPARLDL